MNPPLKTNTVAAPLPIVLCVSLLTFTDLAYARAAELDPKLQLNGVAWAKATYALNDDTMRVPDLDLYRLQLWGTSRLADQWKGHFRLHASTAPGILSAYGRAGSIFVYQAYLERREFLSPDGLLTLGVSTNAFLRDLYRLHGTRFISRLLGQRMGYITPTPLGIRYEYSTPELSAALTLEQTATKPDSPSSHLIGAGTTVHWRPSQNWLLSSHVTHRHQSIDNQGARPSESVFASTVSYHHSALVLSVETAGRYRSGSLELGGGILARLQLFETFHLFGQVIGGNDAFQESLGASVNWRTGPLFQLEDALQIAMIIDAEHSDTNRYVLSLAASKQF